MKISNRLKLIASMVEENSSVFDCGCDHALLDIFLVLNNNNIKCIASDINELPLSSAISNIKLYDVEDKIKTKVSDGIQGIEEDNDTLIISGLGGDTILNILTKDMNKLKNINTIVLSPHGQVPKIRELLTNNNYYIDNEELIYDSGKPYIIIKFKKGNKSYTEKELFLGPILLEKRTEEITKYYKDWLNNLKQVYEKVPEHNEQKPLMKKEIERLNDYFA